MITPASKEVDFRFVARSEDDWAVAKQMQKELAKKYPVQRAILRMRNPHEPGQFPLSNERFVI
jgi:hypothetical protein